MPTQYKDTGSTPTVLPAAVMNWYAIYTRARFEKSVEAELQRKQFETYLPAVNEVHQWKDRSKTVRQPVFPSYVFARFCPTPEAMLKIVQSSGVVRILADGTGILPVPDEQVDAVRRVIDTGISHICPFLKEGATVRVRRGPLKGITGLLVRIKTTARLVVSINLLSRSVSVEIDVRDVENLRS